MQCPAGTLSFGKSFKCIHKSQGNQVWVNHFTRLQQPMSDPTKNQVANRFANQPKDWDMMHCFLLMKDNIWLNGTFEVPILCASIR